MKVVLAIAAVLAAAQATSPSHTPAARCLGEMPGPEFTPRYLAARDDPAVVHVLNRVAFGPRPGDVEKVRTLGIARYIDQQLHPNRIADDHLAVHLTNLPTITMSAREIVQQYEIPQIEARREKQLEAARVGDGSGPDGAPARRQIPMPDPIQQKANSVLIELSEQKILRAVYSERQLQEVLTDFWFNHFNVDARKNRDRFLLTEYERDAIRPHVLGTFRDLLEATAKSPAMLFYLDNWMSNTRKGVNENYGRELMELHTLGVDGGYTQNDVTEVARAFTGWTLENPRQGGGFVFNPRLHDMGPKIVLGHAIAAGGDQSDGEKVLDILASHPSTARFIATKLVRRFVSDVPPPALVDRAAKRFLATKGDLREVMRTILTSKEFLAPGVSGAKIKSPFEFVVSAVRALGADVENATPLVRQLQQLGMPLYQCQPPTGYKDTADAWVNTGALVARMNFAVALTEGKVRGIAVASNAPNAPNAMTIGGPDFQRR